MEEHTKGRYFLETMKVIRRNAETLESKSKRRKLDESTGKQDLGQYNLKSEYRGLGPANWNSIWQGTRPGWWKYGSAWNMTGFGLTWDIGWRIQRPGLVTNSRLRMRWIQPTRFWWQAIQLAVTPSSWPAYRVTTTTYCLVPLLVWQVIKLPSQHDWN